MQIMHCLWSEAKTKYFHNILDNYYWTLQHIYETLKHLFYTPWPAKGTISHIVLQYCIKPPDGAKTPS